MRLPETTAVLICATVFLLNSTRTGAAAVDKDSRDQSAAMWTAGMGISYPLVASISGGVIAPLSDRKRDSPYGFPGVPAIHANLDIGLGGGMVSGGLSFPVEAGYGQSALSVKGAALRAWLIDIGVKRNLTYIGGVMELLFESHPSGKLGLGYFPGSDSSNSPGSGFVYVYFGMGL